MEARLFKSSDEALVFYDWLVRLLESDKADSLHPAEQRVLWDIEAALESELPQILVSDYRSHVEMARERVARSESAGA